MKMVIDISEKRYKDILRIADVQLELKHFQTAEQIISNGTPLTKGHWILDDSDNSITCNNCGCLIYANDILHGEPKYCPNCGADMQEAEGGNR